MKAYEYEPHVLFSAVESGLFTLLQQHNRISLERCDKWVVTEFFCDLLIAPSITLHANINPVSTVTPARCWPHDDSQFHQGYV